MSAPQQEPTLIDLSGARWREARTRAAAVNVAAPYGIKPSSGQLYGPGGDRLYLAIHHSGFPVLSDVAAPVELGERGPLLALLGWARDRGVKTSAATEALSPTDTPRVVSLPAFHQVFVDVQRECAVTGKTAWALLPTNQAAQSVRILVPTEPATTLLATPTAAVGISSDGLHLLRRRLTLTGWRRTAGGLLLTTPHGERRLGPATLSARLLERLGRNAPQIELHASSLSALLAPIVDRLAHLAMAPAGPNGDVRADYVVVGKSTRWS